MAKSDNSFISPKAAQQAHRRRLPALMKKLNKKVREGCRSFSVGTCSDIPEPFFLMVREAMENAEWEVIEERRGSYVGLAFRAKNEQEFVNVNTFAQ